METVRNILDYEYKAVVLWQFRPSLLMLSTRPGCSTFVTETLAAFQAKAT